MAFYKDINKQDRQQKRQSAEQRGGFDDEGRNYSGNRSGRAQSGAQGGRTGGYQGNGAGRGDRPYQGDRPSQGNRPYQGDRPSQGDRPYQGERPPRRDGQSGSYRFVKGAPQTYRDRGAGTKPASYADSRARRDGEGERYDRAPRPQGGRFDGPRPQNGERYDRAPRPQNGGHFDSPRPQGGRFERDAQRGPYREGAPRADVNRTRGGDPEMNRGRYDASRAPRRDDSRGFAVDRGPRADDRRAAPRPRRTPGELAPEAKDYNAFRYQQQARPVPAPAPLEEDMPPENMLCGRNPIREALKSGRDIEKLLVQKGELSGSAREILQLAKDLRVPVQEVEKAHLDTLARSHQGMIAYASAYQYHTVDDMLALAKERGEAPFLILLDGITDPHNLGAIIRTAECAGAHGVIVSERRAVGLTPAAVKASAGAVEHLPVARVVNLSQTLEDLKAQGVWSFAADMEGEDYRGVDFSGPVALVIGAEGEGVSRLLLSKCDHRVSLPQKGEIQSLNASVAAGILMYHILEAR